MLCRLFEVRSPLRKVEELTIVTFRLFEQLILVIIYLVLVASLEIYLADRDFLGLRIPIGKVLGGKEW